ncbi:hypothetical protein [Nonomuraea sp. NPDC049400]
MIDRHQIDLRGVMMGGAADAVILMDVELEDSRVEQVRGTPVPC